MLKCIGLGCVNNTLVSPANNMGTVSLFIILLKRLNKFSSALNCLTLTINKVMYVNISTYDKNYFWAV